ncbi:MAG: hypothetical protein EA384_03370 [Spirochaetaceae bacterium]|nr:MAG: hypothetical protein EA384_03370 [Spirochaetaceae bacterium]
MSVTRHATAVALTLAAILALAVPAPPLGALEAIRPAELPEPPGYGVDVQPAPVILSPYLGLFATQDKLYDEVGMTAEYNSGLFRMYFDLSLINDDKYEPEEPYMLGHYFNLKQGTIEFNYRPISLLFGRTPHRDKVDSPYTMFISSWDIPATILSLNYEDSFFFYESRWIGLNRNSKWYRTPEPIYEWGNEQAPDVFDEDDLDQAGDVDGDYFYFRPLDRGANYKVYGIKLGDWRLGFQESIVYINQSFYPEYFLSPLPMYFTQLVNSTGGKPWTQIDDENSHMGFFVDYTEPRYPNRYGYLQFIMGDINLNFLAPDHDLQHPNKWGWSLGGARDFTFGRLGLYHAGALKYTFAATSANDRNYSLKRYEYTYYPAVEYLFDGGRRALDYRDNYIGYLYGENNLAFMATYEGEANDFQIEGSAEFVVSGSKSPANPWHEYRGHPGRYGEGKLFPLLDESPLEKTVRFSSAIGRSFGPWDLKASAMIGAVFNELELVMAEPPDGETFEDELIQPKLYKPGNNNRLLFEFFVGARYNIGIRPPAN